MVLYLQEGQTYRDMQCGLDLIIALDQPSQKRPQMPNVLRAQQPRHVLTDTYFGPAWIHEGALSFFTDICCTYRDY